MSDSPQTASDAAASPEASAPKAPAEDSAPPSGEPSFGWNAYAERTNGRFAMIGFVALLVLELFTRQSFWSWIGL